MGDKLVDNKPTRRLLESMAEGDEAIYPRYRTEMFMRGFWLVAVAAIFYTNYTMLDAAALTSHIVSFISGFFALKGWNIITPYMEMAEEAGLIIPEPEEEEEED